MNNKDLNKKTKKELIELFKEIKEQNNSLHVSINIRQSLINTLTETNKRKDILISKQEELINVKDEAIRLKGEAIHLEKEISTRKDKHIEELNNKIKKIVNYSIILDVCIIVGALLMVIFS